MKAQTDLAVHAIGHASMAGYAVPEVFDLKAPLEATRKKPAKWCND